MKIFCIGRNYAKHAKELGNDLPTEPLVFCKPETALVKNNGNFYLPDFSKDVHHEVEIVLRVCKQGKHIAEKFAHKYIDQMTVGIDFTARDLQNKLRKEGNPWEIAKGFDGSAPIGTFVPLPDIDTPIEFSLTKNDQIVQQGNTTDLIFPFSRLIAHISIYFTLQQGDLIFTGTPEGVGSVQIGDTLKAFIGDECLLQCAVK
ncbi:MAG TPA: fumarylacetoacetate hydrolase family protein [Chitinophagales bacterium]|jgi:2-keto-4-pentenoate hydratase/2-oxohepta-3-ene-1,7-dioic acid hydratase in catechol pathway|nr:fumarylacetoacetate hydrolase family protein [Chitinophagales bacterium]